MFRGDVMLTKNLSGSHVTAASKSMTTNPRKPTKPSGKTDWHYDSYDGLAPWTTAEDVYNMYSPEFHARLDAYVDKAVGKARGMKPGVSWKLAAEAARMYPPSKTLH
jgi:hypothetical protein